MNETVWFARRGWLGSAPMFFCGASEQCLIGYMEVREGIPIVVRIRWGLKFF